ncbi:hypothetical protein SteCoe_19335 [Stentor coeruleus]|uniref:Bacterial surface antigen (D15) domain-containing protein n=1 Tax=Stentor coeruleus TaxID=5963 RepID=A0A1R2BUJ3_9CILI|nr:hypothetical protein SteCoe_19335 [Stentor coeruleus]
MNEGLNDIADILNEPLFSVDMEFHNTSVDTNILKKYLKTVSGAKSVEQLSHYVAEALLKLDRLEVFKSCEVKILPGKSENTALAYFDLQEKGSFTASAEAKTTNEGGSTEFKGGFRNIRHKADFTEIKAEYKPNTRTYGFALSHYDQLYTPGKYQAIYSITQDTIELDTNLKETNYGGSFLISSMKKDWNIKFGRLIRTNVIRAEHASTKMIRQSLPVNAKNYAQFCYNYSSLNDMLIPTSGIKLNVINEFAYGEDNKFHKIDFKISKYFGLTNNIVFQGSLDSGVFIPWPGSKISINDKYRSRFIKGFQSVGTREPPNDPNVMAKYEPCGDNLGAKSKFNAEGKIHFYNTVGMQNYNLVPFLYGNVVCESPNKFTSMRNYAQDYVRWSAGFGIGLNLGSARLEFAYAARHYAKKCDVTAGFGILVGD